MEFKNFKAIDVPLSGSNLIEASAGTGKTYSIAILVLRLLLEHKIPVKEILMVTFTKAAVAELEERIRLFIRLAHKASKGEGIGDSTIKALVDNAIEYQGEETVIAVLQEAILFLDETSVLTIHSFCQQTLNEFAFETKQLFGADLTQDISTILDDEINKFWRKNITIIPAELLSVLMQNGLSRAAIFSVVEAHVGGKRYMNFDATKDYTFSIQQYDELILSVNQLQLKEEQLRNCLVQHVIDNRESLTESCNRTAYTRNNVLHLFDTPVDLLALIKEKSNLVNILKVFGDLVERINECDAVLDECNQIGTDVIRKIYCLAINEAVSGIDDYKSINNQLSYDDLIVNLHTALVERDNPKLVERLQVKYKAVFIDEFQDTDRMQYEIFEKAFGSNTILFYIGDPKQSIYAWRKADIFTYFKAKSAVDNLYSMNQNYRSAANYISAMNAFFKPNEAFDTFHFEGAAESINYFLVDSPDIITKGTLIRGEEAEKAITITSSANKPDICAAVANQVLHLLTNKDLFIADKKGKRKIRPNDIGILVRKNQEGHDIKQVLSRYAIPSVTITESKVLLSEEARYVMYVLEAMADISISSINKALRSPFTGFDDLQILTMDSEYATELFRKYKATWEKDGIYTALHKFTSDYGVKDGLLSSTSGDGERVITNLYQIIELLHKTQTTKKLSVSELISWLSRCISGMETEGDEYEQRVENDNEAVKIVTIHKSKGLEYNIVLAPFLDLVTANKYTSCSFRDPHSGEYVSGEKEQLTEEQNAENSRQLEQENRRLIYVAITRAVYKCYIFNNTRHPNSSLVKFMNALRSGTSMDIEFGEVCNNMDDVRYISNIVNVPDVPNTPFQFRLLQQNWRRMSYSMLSSEHKTSLKLTSNSYQDDYEKFIFSTLQRGVKTGNLLHHIFENINFSDEGRWAYTINDALSRFTPDSSETYAPMLTTMLHHVFSTKIEIGEDSFRLAQLQMQSCINEFEFDFSVSPFRVGELKALGDDRIHIDVRDFKEVEGVMNGKIDLFFEFGGKYYILDWKSNYLGDSLTDYSPDSLLGAMNENNYHLQYLIYTLAVKKYLESRLFSFDYETQFGGVIYLFLRGVRDTSDTGVFVHKPFIETIDLLDNLLSQNEVLLTH